MQGLMERLLPHWQRFCAPEGLFAVWLADRSTNYLDTSGITSGPASGQTEPGPVAGRIVAALLRAVGSEESGRDTERRALTQLLAHRIASDGRHFSDLKARFDLVGPCTANA